MRTGVRKVRDGEGYGDRELYGSEGRAHCY